MNAATVFIVIGGLLGFFALPPAVNAAEQKYLLEFRPTGNLLAAGGTAATGTMHIKVKDNGTTAVHFTLRGARQNTLYTIWIVFNKLTVDLAGNPQMGADGQTVLATPAIAAYPSFPPEGNGVSPLARLDKPFTDGMGLDPGATFITNAKGDADVQVKLDYDLVHEAPVSNKDIIVQCVPGPPVKDPATGKESCPAPSKVMRVTTTWLRQFIAQTPNPADPVKGCTNYDPTLGQEVLYWQCIDPATVDPRTGNGLPRVPRFSPDHFRLAAHPDHLTHGFIGGNHEYHRIDMTGSMVELIAVH